MKSRFHKKLSLKKITISTHTIYGGNEDDTERSSAYHAPTEIILEPEEELKSRIIDICP
ncbi:hypothetical protein [Kordia sp.]|uniref:hypothetical protein n=1 Tax=Kordia sp. TaxID=1965332 RepID=UPI003B5BDB1F